LGHLVCRGKQ